MVPRDPERPSPDKPIEELETFYPQGDEPSEEPTEAPSVEPEPAPPQASRARVAEIERTMSPFGSEPLRDPERTVHPFGSEPPRQTERTVHPFGSEAPHKTERTAHPFGAEAAPQQRAQPLRPGSPAPPTPYAPPAPSAPPEAPRRPAPPSLPVSVYQPPAVPVSAPGAQSATEVAPAPGTESLDQLARRLSNAFTRELSPLAHQCVARAAGDTLEARRALVATWSLTDGAAVTKMIDHGVRADSIAIVSFVPLAAAAWADGKFSKNERAAALEISEQIGLSPSDTIQPALVERLDAALDEPILRAWLAYVDVFSSRVDADVLSQVLDRIRDGALRIAEASGGFLGVGRKVSDAEAALLQRLENPKRMTITPFSS